MILDQIDHLQGQPLSIPLRKVEHLRRPRLLADGGIMIIGVGAVDDVADKVDEVQVTAGTGQLTDGVAAILRVGPHIIVVRWGIRGR